MLATRDDVYQNFPSTAPTRYETLSAAQSLASLERALHTLLSPFDYSTAAEWLDAACTAMGEVTGSEFRMPTVASGETAWDAIERALDAYAARVSAAATAENLQRAAMIRVLVPPFKAGVSEWRRLASRRTELAALLDAIPEPVLMYDGSGGLVHANPRAAALFGMPGAAGPGAQVRTEAQRMAWSLAAAAQRSAKDAGNESKAGNWLQVAVEGKSGVNRNCIGAVVRVYPAGKLGDAASLWCAREIAVGYGYASGQEAIAHIGLGTMDQCDVEVILPHGKGKLEQKGVKANQRMVMK